MTSILLLALLVLFVPGCEFQVFAQDLTPFDEYGDIRGDDASARLDNFAIELMKDPQATGWIYCYGAEGDGSGTGKFICETTKSYLIQTRGLDPESLKTRYVGRYIDSKEPHTILYILPQELAAPEPIKYSEPLKPVIGLYEESVFSDGINEGEGDGPNFGNKWTAATADQLKSQPDDDVYLVVFNPRKAAYGLWRRAADHFLSDLESYGIAQDRVKVIFGGVSSKGEDDNADSAPYQLWILKKGSQPPVKKAKTERAPKEAVDVATYQNFELRKPSDFHWIVRSTAESLTADKNLTLCLILHPLNPVIDPEMVTDGDKDIEPSIIVDKWKSQFKEKYGISDDRVVVFTGSMTESNSGSIEVWFVPPGAGYPDPFKVDPDLDDDGQEPPASN